MIALIERACLPLIQKQDIKTVAAQAGLRKTRDAYVLQLEGVQKITLTPPTVANPDVCTLTVNHDVDQAPSFVDALSAWTASRNPPIPPLGARYQISPNVFGWSWSLDTGTVREGVAFTAQKQADGRPVGKAYDVSVLLFSHSGG